ncbi:MAG: hypothetical protein Q8J97_02325, partial [Flavobacteriaceae bacterium]|nr:hypothetical protein [Flavobacteriaceae bacterium]
MTDLPASKALRETTLRLLSRLVMTELQMCSIASRTTAVGRAPFAFAASRYAPKAAARAGSSVACESNWQPTAVKLAMPTRRLPGLASQLPLTASPPDVAVADTLHRASVRFVASLFVAPFHAAMPRAATREVDRPVMTESAHETEVRVVAVPPHDAAETDVASCPSACARTVDDATVTRKSVAVAVA